MRVMLTVVLVCAFVVSVPPATAQQSTPVPPVSDPQAVSLLQKSLAVQVGTLQVADVTLSGTAQRIAGSDNENGTATLKATVLGDSRIDLSFQSGNRSEIRNHSALPLPSSVPPGVPAPAEPVAQPAGAWSGPDGVMYGMANQNVMTDGAWFFPAATLARVLSSEGYLFSYLGPETHDGQSVLHVQITEPLPAADNAPEQIATLKQHLTQMDVYFDPATLLPAALDFSIHPDNNAVIDFATEVRFSEYRAVSGVAVPFHVQKFVNSGLVLDLQFANAAVNSGVPASTFQFQ
jgi:hypothetical protein